MSINSRASLWISFVLIVSVMLLCMPASAVNTDVTGGKLLSSQDEGVVVDYQIVVSGIPKQASVIEMYTDLIPVSDQQLWTVETEGLNLVDGEKSLNEPTLRLNADGGLPESIKVSVTGRVPVLTSIEVVDGVVVTTRVTKKTGYTYYQVKAIDANGQTVGQASTATFSITIPGEAQFNERVNAITDKDLRVLAQDLYSKGLTDEANEVLKYAEIPRESTMPFMTSVIIGIVLLIIGLVVGVFLGTIRAKNMQDYQSEY